MRRSWLLLVGAGLPYFRERKDELHDLVDRLSARGFPHFYPRAAYIDVRAVEAGAFERIHVFRGQGGDADAHLLIDVDPARRVTPAWLEQQILAGFDALAAAHATPVERRESDTLPVLMRGVGAKGEPVTVGFMVMMVGPPMAYVWTLSHLEHGPIAAALQEWWRPSGRADLDIELEDVLHRPLAKVRMEKFVCRVWVPIARPAPTASVRELILQALAGARVGLELARKRAGLAEPAPLPTDDEFVRGVLDLRGSRFDDRG